MKVAYKINELLKKAAYIPDCYFEIADVLIIFALYNTTISALLSQDVCHPNYTNDDPFLEKEARSKFVFGI
jgi:hypothetical protein